jgi:hypothetical protein
MLEFVNQCSVGALICLLFMKVKDMCRRELDRLESENNRNQLIVAEYKQVNLFFCTFLLHYYCLEICCFRRLYITLSVAYC